MMIVHFYAHSALTAVKRPWWPQKLTSVTVAQLILLFLGFNKSSAIIDIWVKSLGQILELFEVVKLVNTICDAHFFKL